MSDLALDESIERVTMPAAPASAGVGQTPAPGPAPRYTASIGKVQCAPEMKDSIRALAEYYGVSDATIIRWALERGLPIVGAYGGANPPQT